MDPQGGCFSWSPLGKSRHPSRTNTPVTQEESVVPDTQEYITASGKEVLRLAAELVPLPLLKDVLGAAIKIIEVCENATAVEEKFRELQECVEALMIAIVKNVTAGSEEAKMVAASMEIEINLKDLLDTMKTIISDITKIRHKRLLMIILSNLNKNKVDGCVGRLTVALEKFNVGNNLRQTRALQDLQGQLKIIQSFIQSIADQVNDIKNFGEVVASVKQEASAKKPERQDTPSKPVLFFGHDGLVEKVSAMLTLDTASHICLLGSGGIGKTSLSLAIVDSDLVQAKFQDGHRVWVPCVEATSANLFLQVLHTSLRVKRQTDSVMSDILYELKSSKDPYLLLLDNFGTPWNTSDKKQVDEALSNLNQLSHVSILITMQGSQSPTVDVEWHLEIVPANEKDASLRICQSFNPHWEMDPDLDRLLDAVGCMPLAVTLMASRGRESESSPKQLLEEWTSLGTDIQSPDGSLEGVMDKSISLSVDSNFVKSNPDAIDLLATLSLLPAGTTIERLAYWAPNLKSMSGAITTLSRASLLQTITRDRGHTSQTLFVLPVIQSFMVHQKRIPENLRQGLQSAFCKYVLDHASRYRDPTFEANFEALAKEDVNIQSILVGTTNRTDQLVQALLAFSWYRRDTKPLIAVAEQTLNVAKANGNKRYIAEALLCLGSSYSQVKKFVEAKGVLEESSRLLAADDSGQSKQLGFECALAHMHVSLYTKGHKRRQTIISDLLSRTNKSDTYWHACALDALGWLYWVIGNCEQALETFVEAADMMRDLGCKKDMASTLYAKAYACDRLYIPDEAVYMAVQEAWEIAGPLEPSYVQGNILLLLGQVFVRMGRLVDAMNTFEKCLNAYQYIGVELGVAQTLDNIGFIYLHTGAYSDAYSAFETAAETYAGLGEDSPDGRISAPRCRTNMEKSKLKQEDPDQRLDFYRPGGTREWEVPFYPARLTL